MTLSRKWAEGRWRGEQEKIMGKKDNIYIFFSFEESKFTHVYESRWGLWKRTRTVRLGVSSHGANGSGAMTARHEHAVVKSIHLN